MKTTKVMFAAGIILASFSNRLKAQDVNEILAKHAIAMGGTENWNKIKTMKVKCTAGYGLKRTSTLKPGKAMRFDNDFGGVINRQAAINENNGWVKFMTWEKNSDSIGIDAMHVFWPEFDFETVLLLNYKDNGTKVEYAGMEDVSDVPCYKIKYTSSNGHESTCFINKNSFYIVRSESTVSVKDEEREAVVIYGNYTKTEEGIVLPMSVTTNNGEMLIEKVQINIPVSDSFFQAAPPEEK